MRFLCALKDMIYVRDIIMVDAESLDEALATATDRLKPASHEELVVFATSEQPSQPTRKKNAGNNS